MENSVKLTVMFLAFQKPIDWEVNGNKGRTHRISILALDTGEPGTVKVSEELYNALKDNGVTRSDDIVLVFKSKFVLSVINGRPVQELKFIPDTFEIPDAAD